VLGPGCLLRILLLHVALLLPLLCQLCLHLLFYLPCQHLAVSRGDLWQPTCNCL
jgi:hypothetical protein